MKPKSSRRADDFLARDKAVEPVQLLGKLQRAFGQAAQIILVVDKGKTRLLVEHVDLRQAMALADFKVVEVVRRGDLDRARTLFGIGVFVADDRNAAADQRQNDMLADQMIQPLVLRMDRDRGVAEHGFRTHRRDHDERRWIVRAKGFAFDRIAQIPEAAS